MFKREISAFSSDFYPQLDKLIAPVVIPKVDDEPALLWGDAFFYNLLVRQDNGRVRVTAIYDFQSARYGSRMLDFLNIEEGFRHQAEGSKAPHPEVYSGTFVIDEIYKGYRETCSMTTAFDTSYLDLADVIRKAHLVHYWWDCTELLHPKTPQMLDGILAALTKLASIRQ